MTMLLLVNRDRVTDPVREWFSLYLLPANSVPLGAFSKEQFIASIVFQQKSTSTLQLQSHKPRLYPSISLNSNFNQPSISTIHALSSSNAVATHVVPEH